ncbi:hypothetical protein Tco_0572264 [Tanacetum coccineum]
MWLIVVSDEEATMNLEILHTRYPIVDWESQSLGSEHVYKIINTSYHKTFESMLKRFDRQDLVDLHGLVMKRFKDNTPEGYNLILLGDLKTISYTTLFVLSSSISIAAVSTASEIDIDSGSISTVAVSTASEIDTVAAEKAKEKGKGIMIEPEPPKKLKKRVQVQLTVDEELAKKLFEEECARFNAEQEARAKEEQEQEKSDFEVAQELQKQLDERRKANSIEWNTIVEQLQERQSDTIKRYQALKRKPISVAQARKNMMIYLKNMARYKMEYFKGINVEEEKGQKNLEEFAEKTETEPGVKEISKKTGGMRRKLLARKRTRETQDEDTSKRQKLDEEEAADYEEEKEELRMWLIVVSDEEATVNPEILHTRYPIVDWESQSLGSEHVYKIINTSYHKTFESMLKRFDRQDLVDLHGLVMKRFKDNTPEGYNLILLGDLKTMFEPDAENEVWSNQQDWTLINTASGSISIAAVSTASEIDTVAAEKAKEKAKKLFEEERARFNAEQEARAKEEQEQEKSDFESDTIKRYQALKRKPISVAQARKNMMIYLKNITGYKMEYFKGMSYDDIRPIFEVEYNKISKKTGGMGRKSLARKRTRETQDEDTSKRQKLDEEEAADYEEEKEELRMCLGSEHVYKIIRADGNTSYHKTFESMLKRFDRQDLMDLHGLVMKRFKYNTPEGYNLILWGDLKTMFEPDAKNEVWSNQQDWTLISWKLYENCEGHTLLLDGTLISFHMLVEKRYPFTKEMLEKMLNWRLEAEAENTMAFELLKIVKSQIE